MYICIYIYISFSNTQPGEEEKRKQKGSELAWCCDSTLQRECCQGEFAIHVVFPVLFPLGCFKKKPGVFSSLAFPVKRWWSSSWWSSNKTLRCFLVQNKEQLRRRRHPAKCPRPLKGEGFTSNLCNLLWPGLAPKKEQQFTVFDCYLGQFIPPSYWNSSYIASALGDAFLGLQTGLTKLLALWELQLPACSNPCFWDSNMT